jgi:hypothetical protein
MLLSTVGNAIATTPDKSPQRRSSRKQAPSADSRSGVVLDFGKEASSVTSSSVKVVDPPLAHTRANSKKPAAVPNATTATFNPSQHRVTTRLLVSAWCLPIKSSVALQQHNAAVLLGAADAYIFDSHG